MAASAAALDRAHVDEQHFWHTEKIAILENGSSPRSPAGLTPQCANAGTLVLVRRRGELTSERQRQGEGWIRFIGETIAKRITEADIGRRLEAQRLFIRTIGLPLHSLTLWYHCVVQFPDSFVAKETPRLCNCLFLPSPDGPSVYQVR